MPAHVRSWGVVAAFAAVAAVTQMVWLTFAAVTTVAAQHYGVSDSAIGWLAQPFVLFYVVFAIPAGLLLDRHFRLWLSVGAVLTALGACVRLVGGNYAWLMVGAVLASLAQPLVLNAMTGIAAQHLPEKDRPSAIGFASASVFAGMVMSFVLGIAFSTADAMPTLVAVEAGIAVLAAGLLVVALRKPAPFAIERKPAGLAPFRAAWSKPLIRMLCVFVFLPFGVFISLTTWTEVLLEPAGVSTDQAGIVLVVMVLAGVAGSAILPAWAARRGWEIRIGVTALCVTAVACLALAVRPGFVTGLIALALVGFLALAVLPVVLELTERGAEDSEGTASGLIWMAGNLGGLVVATVIGFTTGAPGFAFALLAIVSLAGLPVLRLLRRPVAALPSVT